MLLEALKALVAGLGAADPAIIIYVIGGVFLLFGVFGYRWMAFWVPAGNFLVGALLMLTVFRNSGWSVGMLLAVMIAAGAVFVIVSVLFPWPGRCLLVFCSFSLVTYEVFATLSRYTEDSILICIALLMGLLAAIFCLLWHKAALIGASAVAGGLVVAEILYSLIPMSSPTQFVLLAFVVVTGIFVYVQYMYSARLVEYALTDPLRPKKKKRNNHNEAIDDRKE